MNHHLSLASLLGTLLLFTTARAETTQREKYERDLIEASMKSLGLEVDPEPEGKTIEEVIIVRHPIVEANDPWPYFFNVFHVVTRVHIVAQELLFAPGQVYDDKLVDESARNLRAMPLLFSTVRIIVTRGSKPDKIKVVVITKDLWSIRINSNFSVGGGVFNFVSFMPSEMNFLGYNQQVSLLTQIARDVFSLGQVYRVPRLFGSRFTFQENLGLRLNHHDGNPEGGFGSAVFGLPLYAISSHWGFSLTGSFDIATRRIYDRDRIAKVTDWDIDYVYDQRHFAGQAQVVRSFGQRFKTNLSFGYNLRATTYDLPDDFPDVPAEGREQFIGGFLPYDDEAGELFFNLDFYEATYRRFLNVQTYGLTEDFRFGPQASLQLAWASPAFGFAQTSALLRLILGYRFYFGEDILVVSASLSTRWRPDHELAETGSEWVDRRGEIFIENVSPELFGLGRLFFHFHYAYTQYMANRTELFLGGDTTLRGFPTNAFRGPRLFNLNIEFRSRPWELRTLHIGFVVFYDGGDAYGFKPETDFVYHQSIGIGIRGLFPQFDRGTMRLDIGIPLGRDFHTSVIEWISLAYLQAF